MKIFLSGIALFLILTTGIIGKFNLSYLIANLAWNWQKLTNLADFLPENVFAQWEEYGTFYT